MTDRRCVVFDDDLIAAATSVSGGGGGAWTIPATQITTVPLTDPARFVPVGAGTATIDITFSRRRSIAAIAMLGVGLDYAVSSSGWWRVTFHADAIGGDVVATYPIGGGWTRRVARAFATRTRPISTVNWWSGRIPSRDTVVILDRAIRCVAMRIEIDPEGGVLDIGRIWAGGLIRTAWGIDWGRTRAPGLKTLADPLPGGAHVFDVRPNQRRQKLAWRELTQIEGDRMHDLIVARDRHLPWVVVPDPGAGAAMARDPLYVRLSPDADPTPVHVGHDKWTVEADFLEVID